MSARRAFVLAGGGTGGHISPGLAIAERLKEKSPESRPVFACSARPIDARMLREADAEFEAIPAEPFSLSPAKLARCAAAWWRGRRAAADLLRRVRAERVVALGGFVTVPVVSAARSVGVPVLLVNLDATPGRANMTIARRAQHVLSAVPTPDRPAFSARIERVIGMPIRRVAMAPADPVTCREALGLVGTDSTLLVTGASQGAASLNELLLLLATRHPEIFVGWQVLHLCGHGDAEAIRRAYAAAGVRARVEPFLDRMGLAWGAADLALSRAGANSVAEAAANAVPTIFAPYPYHRDLHQKHNAQPLVDEGAAAMELDRIDAEANLAGLGRSLRELMTDPPRRRAMRDRLLARPREDAAATIADELLAGP